MSSPTVAAAAKWTAAHDLAAATAWFGQHDGPVVLKGTGKVLVVGGVDATGAAVGRAAVYDPTADTWTGTATQPSPRRLHSVTAMADGKVLVAGGIGGSTAPGLASAEVYDPAADTWTPVGTMSQARWGHSAVLLPSGKVLVAGGSAVRAGTTVRALRSAELFDPATGGWAKAADLTDARSGHVAVALNGKVLVVGGTASVGTDQEPALAFCEVYDPATDSWSPTGSLLRPRALHQAAALSDTTVLVTGGRAPGAGDDGTFDPFSRRTAEKYDLATGVWTAAADMPAGRARHRAVALGPGAVLVVGGTGSDADEAGYRSVVQYDAAADTWTARPGLLTGRWGFAAAVLSDGRVLAAGGAARTGLAAADPTVTELTAAAELFDGSGA
ncbi:kelch repeat-containing protein [Kitasatospora sp. CB02891]|uniref:Kelch repeat-containing protein n=1 Tax=Kitasatospora sp. CB02891 TaxID=2020329 RepID=UPI000C26EB13|nr:kelch repeat-containing protein [Kitasatospora sp. CB02891]PJN26148.1 Kelch-like protein 17 [Kitasatospora sp. CB02891]